jgi:hypothetical protein
MNTIVRTIGGAIGAVIAATILAGNVLPGGRPDRHGYTITFVICGVVMVVGVLASLAVPGRRRQPQAVNLAPVTAPARAGD